MKIYVMLLISVISLSSYSIDAYKCRVLDAVDLTDSGKLELTNLAKMYIDAEFVVDKDNGKMVGKIGNSNAFGTPKVLDRGSNEQSFKVVTIYQPYVNIETLYIEEFNENLKKPFTFSKGGLIASGLCDSY